LPNVSLKDLQRLSELYGSTATRARANVAESHTHRNMDSRAHLQRVNIDQLPEDGCP